MTRGTRNLAAVLTGDESNTLLHRLGYDQSDADALHSSGILAVDTALLSEESRLELLGSNPVDLFSPDSHWQDLHFKKHTGGVFLIDFYSGAAFRPVELKAIAMYGPKGLEGPRSNDLTTLSMNWRWRFNRIHVYCASTEDDLQRLGRIIAGAPSSGVPIFFRGQTKNYSITRHPRICEVFYGNTSTTEPSLLTTAFRSGFPYASIERYWHAMIADIDHRLTGFLDKRWWVEDAMEDVFVGTSGHIARWHRVSTMAMAQHYGIPTYGLDVTKSVRIAWWFATHAMVLNDGRARYSPHSWSESDPTLWPVVYVFRGGNDVNIGNIELPATRPDRQDAYFLQGGWGAHGNICADDLLGAIHGCPVERLSVCL